MTIGEKIRKYRLMNHLTQKELGLLVGFSPSTADSRIRKYERNISVPKEELKLKIAEVLDVDISALSNINIQTSEDIMQVLFMFEETLGMDISVTEDQTFFIFDNSNTETAKLISYFHAWHTKKKMTERLLLLAHMQSKKESEKALSAYQQWKAKFPSSALALTEGMEEE